MSRADEKVVQRAAAPMLVEWGLLFEINRTILHPLGLALQVEEGEDGELRMSQMMRVANDPEGFLFTPDAYKDGEAKLAAFMKAVGTDKLNQRLAGVRCVQQCWPEHGHGEVEEPNSEICKQANELAENLRKGGGVYRTMHKRNETPEKQGKCADFGSTCQDEAGGDQNEKPGTGGVHHQEGLDT